MTPINPVTINTNQPNFKVIVKKWIQLIGNITKIKLVSAQLKTMFNASTPITWSTMSNESVKPSASQPILETRSTTSNQTRASKPEVPTVSSQTVRTQVAQKTRAVTAETPVKSQQPGQLMTPVVAPQKVAANFPGGQPRHSQLGLYFASLAGVINFGSV